MIARLGVASAVVMCAAPVTAELPDPVRRMIEAAAETGDAAKLAAVVEAAKATNPDDSAAIDALLAAGRARQGQIAAAAEEQRREAILTSSFLQNWHGQGELGGFNSTGNSENLGVTLALRLNREGIDWTHRIRASIDYQETGNVTTREQYFLSYEPRFQISPRLFAYALGQFDKDEFQGYDARFAFSGGLGYELIDSPSMHLSLKAGPAWRTTKFTDGRNESSIAALGGFDFDWRLARGIKLTQTTDVVAEGGASATAIIDSTTTSLNLVTGLEAAIIDSLTARISYAVRYNSNPPPGSESTDTTSRFTLIYGF